MALAMLMSNMSPKISAGMGLLFYDKQIKVGIQFHYVVQIRNTSIQATTTVNTKSPTIIKPPKNLSAEFADSSVYIRWQVSDTLLHSAYILERSDDGSASFRAVDQTPILVNQEPDSLGRIFVSKIDKLPKLYYNYYYRIRAITPFGELSNPSGIIQVFGHLQKLPAPVVKQKIIQNKYARLTWTFPDSLNKYIAGFQILRSDKLDGNYKYLNMRGFKPQSRFFIDSLPAYQNYYKIAVLDWVGKETFGIQEFVQIEDTTPPSKPIIVESRVNKLGVIRIKWKANKEKDLLGYRIFMGNNKKAEFSLMPTAFNKDTVYMDTLSLKLLDKEVYYTLVAFDTHLNASVQSDTVLLKRPDIIPPAAPNFTNYILSDSTIHLFWNNSPSNDLAKTLLMRRSAGDSIATKLATFLASQKLTSFIDTTALPQKIYEYQLIAYDDAGLKQKEPCKIELSMINEGYKPKIRDVKIACDTLQKTISLKWTYSHPDLDQFIVYRKKGKEGYLSAFKFLPKNFNTYLETEVQLDTPYAYAVMATFKDGTETKLTLPIEMVIQSPKK
jgi:fibronectin type 3 domain-containing protein